MKPLQLILDFLLSVATLFFRTKRNCKPGKPLVDGTGHPVCLPSEPGGSACSHRSDTGTVETRPAATPVNLLGWALIVCAAGGYLFKLAG